MYFTPVGDQPDANDDLHGDLGTAIAVLPLLSTLDVLESLARSATREISASDETVLDIGTARDLGRPPLSPRLHIAMTRRQPKAALPLARTDA
jgi:hypothetical protein